MMKGDVMIKFVSADNGFIELSTDAGGVIARVNTAESVAYVVNMYGYTGAYYSSSMDFADEEGFEYASQAKEIFEAGVEMAQNNS